MSSSNHSASLKAILYAFLANLGIAIAKSFAAFYTASGSMLAEAVHSFADCSNQILLYVGLVQSRKQPNEKHPLGYGKATYIWSFIVALLLFSVGGLFSIYEGWHKIHQTEPLSSPWIAIVVLVLSILLEAASLKGCLSEVNKIRQNKHLWDWIKTTRNAELVVVLGEDIAAILGLIVALLFVMLTIFTGNPVYDAVGSICIGVILLFISVAIALRIQGLIIGRSAEPEMQALIDQIISANPAIVKALSIITLQLGAEVMLAAKIQMQSNLSITEAIQSINQLEKTIKSKVPEVRWCFIEPDNVD